MRSISVSIGLVLSLTGATPGAHNSLCSKVSFVSVQMSNSAHMIATALNDTMVAGRGAVQYRTAPGHFGPQGDTAIFGQVMAVEKLGGKAAAGLPPGVRHVVIVPWDYDASCAPVPWTRDARWVMPGTRGLFTAELRDPKHWAYGLPTFDVHTPSTQPYPPQPGRGSRSVREVLTIDELFPVMSLFPGVDELRSSPRDAVKPLMDWARANPELAKRYPVNSALSHAYFELHRAKLRSIVPAVAGTYQLTVALGDGPERTFFARTRALPTTDWPPTLGPPADPTSEPPRPNGYYLLVGAALAAEELPATCRSQSHQGYFAVVDPAGVADTKARTWEGNIELQVLEQLFPEDAALRQFARDEFARFSRSKLPPQAHARFTRAADGTVRVDQTIRFEDGRALRIQGVRTSRVSIDCDR